MTTKKDTTEDLKAILSAELGGEASDWKRLSKKRAYGDTVREFENKAKGEKVTVYERGDGLVYAETAGGKEITARLPFNAAAKPSVVDVVMNRVLEGKFDDEAPVDQALYAQAVKDGLVRRFSFYVEKYDDGVGEEGEQSMFAVIYPTVRDETFKCASIIAPMVPKANDTDECMVTEWRFPESMNTPGKIVKHLESLGMTLDVEWQQHADRKAVYNEIVRELGAAKPAARAKGPKT